MPLGMECVSPEERLSFDSVEAQDGKSLSVFRAF